MLAAPRHLRLPDRARGGRADRQGARALSLNPKQRKRTPALTLVQARTLALTLAFTLSLSLSLSLALPSSSATANG